MGWKNLKQHFRIGHIIARYEGEGICIGSSMAHRLIHVADDGTVRWGALGSCRNDDLERYFQEMSADPARVAALIAAPDTFERSLPIYTFKGGEVLAKECEEVGWPNVTHDGLVIDADFSTDPLRVALKAKNDAAHCIRAYQRRVREARAELERMEANLAQSEADLAKLDLDFPAVVLPPLPEDPAD